MDKQQIFSNLSQKYGISVSAVEEMAMALQRGNLSMAQFNHPDLGGLGQWMQGGMTMVGDMFNNQLKYTVDNLCSDLVFEINQNPITFKPLVSNTSFQNDSWYPASLGVPSSSGGQNATRYAYFPQMQRLAVQINGLVSIYSTTGYDIYGFGQQQPDANFLTMSTQVGTIYLNQLTKVDM
jgi:hypothetical protein